MTLSEYHKKYQAQSDEEIKRKVQAKEQELKEVFAAIRFTPTQHPVRIAVLGCGDRRFVPAHKIMFEKLLGKPVIVTTFDITTEHLLGQLDVVQHDCAKPLPNKPYNITYAHVLLKFIETEKQWNVIKNSYEALTGGGIAIHILDKEDYTTKADRLPGGLYSVPLERWKKKLAEDGMIVTEVPLKTGPKMEQDALALVIQHQSLLSAEFVENSLGATLQQYARMQQDIQAMLRPYQNVFASIAQLGNQLAPLAQAVHDLKNNPFFEEMRRATQIRIQMGKEMEAVLNGLKFPKSPLFQLPEIAESKSEITVQPKAQPIEPQYPVEPKAPIIKYVPEAEVEARLAQVKKEVKQEVIDELLEKLDPRFNQILDAMQKKPASGLTLLYLSSGADLYKEPKAKYCYRMQSEQMRVKILRILNSQFKSTDEIQAAVGSSSAASVRSAIDEINRHASRFLNLKSDLIEGRRGSGYRIADKFVIEYV